MEIFGHAIGNINQTKFLGVVIDDKLSWKPHVQFVCMKVSRIIGIFRRLDGLLTPRAKIILYYGLVYSHLQYGIACWGGVCSSDFEKLFRLQKAVIRLLANAKKFAHTAPLFRDLSLVKLADVRRLEMCKFVHRDLFYLNKFDFNRRSDTHSHNTRFNDLISLPFFYLKKSQQSVFYFGLKLYNELPAHLKVFSDKVSFKINLKSYILSDY